MSYCDWSNGNQLLGVYHDHEWGVPITDDRLHFEYLMLEAMQCGLSWSLMLKKRDLFRLCFDNFDYERVAKYTDYDVQRVFNTDGMIRSLPKIRAVVHNANCFINIRKEFGSFSNYIWGYTDGKTILYEGHSDGLIPVSNALSNTIAKDLKKRGFKFLGGVTVYSYLQACGIINDHDKNCPCFSRINSRYPTCVRTPDGEQNTKLY